MEDRSLISKVSREEEERKKMSRERGVSIEHTEHPSAEAAML